MKNCAIRHARGVALVTFPARFTYGDAHSHVTRRPRRRVLYFTSRESHQLPPLARNKARNPVLRELPYTRTCTLFSTSVIYRSRIPVMELVRQELRVSAATHHNTNTIRTVSSPMDVKERDRRNVAGSQ